MKKRLRLIFTISVITAFVLVEAAAAAQSARPRFKDYAVAEAYTGKTAALDLRDPDARTYRTRLREAATQKPNFAGHYIVTAWGCGAQCLLPAIIDAKTGKVYFPFTVCCWGSDVDDPLAYRLDSKLFIVNGSRNEEAVGGLYYYTWQNNKLTLIQTEKAGPDKASPSGAEMRLATADA